LILSSIIWWYTFYLIICIYLIKWWYWFLWFVISALFNCMRFGWDFAYFTVMNHEPANKSALHILLLWDMNLLIRNIKGLSLKALINHVDRGLTSWGKDQGFKSQGTNQSEDRRLKSHGKDWKFKSQGTNRQ